MKSYDADTVPSSAHNGGKSAKRRKSELEDTVLRALAYCGRMTCFDLKQYDSRSHKIREGSKQREYSSGHRAMKRLESSGLVEEVGRERGKKGAETILYDLTVAGLARTIPYLNATEIRQASQKHRDLLPEIFDLWSSFSKEDEPLAVERLKFACRDTVNREDVVTHFLHPEAANWPDADEWKRLILANEKLKEATVRFTLQHAEEILLGLNEDRRLLRLPELKLTPADGGNVEALKKQEERIRNIERVLERLEANDALLKQK